jgi:hypothetical protein
MKSIMLDSLSCSICGGTMTKVSENEAVCTNDEQHRRKIKLAGTERSLFKGSIGMHVGYPSDFSNNMSGRNFTYRVVAGKPHLRIDMSHNLGSRADDIAYDARQLVERHELLSLVSDHERRSCQEFRATG